MNEIDYAALFGVEETGAEEQEVAEPAEAEEPAEGAEERETAEPADDPSAAEEPETPEEPEQPENSKTPRDARYAAARRKAEAERDAAVAEVRAQSRKEMDAFVAGLNLENPYTGQKILTRADYEAYQTAHAEKQRENIQRKAGLDDAGFRQFVESLPEVREAREAKVRAAAAEEQARNAEIQAGIDEQLREIGELDPTIKNLSDLTKMPNYEAFYGLVNDGKTLTEAYKLVNFDAARASAAQAAKQAALNAANSKNHLKGTSARGAGAQTVPEDVKAMYRVFEPDATDAEIQAHYNRSRNKS